MSKKSIITIVVSVVIVVAIVIAVVFIGGGNSSDNNHSASDNNSPSHTHAFGEWEITKSAGCTLEGSKERYCSCGEKQIQSISATGHNYGEWFVVKEANCIEAGSKERSCVCGEKQTQNISATGHTEGPWIIEKESTCTEDGKKVKKCKYCQKIMESIVLPAAHEYVNEVCSVCGKGVFSIVIPSMPQTINTDFGTYYTMSSATIKSVTYKMEECVWEDGTYNLTFYYEGEKTYDMYGANGTESCRVAIYLYDSEGYLIDWGWSSQNAKVGDKFKGKVSMNNVALDKQESYRIEISGNI